MKKISLKNILWKEGKYFVVQCLNVDVSSFGKNKKEALANLHEALELYFDDNQQMYSPLKIEKPEIVAQNFVYA
ncbi:MAG: hypothetical protein AUJ25_02815 [Parcubacteria group bacterium CG1_02_37_13]|nr:MAG: hypothetical protein AUJ25_02815 [Parcubacteria group bacterium CG1_02_37_13]